MKITRSLVEAGVFDRVVIVARWEPGLPERERLDPHREVWRLRERWAPLLPAALRRPAGFAEWLARVVATTYAIGPECVNAHSLVVLPAGVLLKAVTRSRLVYDTHELETEVMQAGPLRKLLSKAVERLCIRQADVVVAVGNEIAKWYRETYPGVEVGVVRNFPHAVPAGPASAAQLKSSLKISERDVLFLYLGLLAPGRGVDLLLDVFERSPPGKHLLLVGYGPLEQLARDRAARFPQVHFMPAVEPDAVRHVARGADVGLSIIENASLSYYYSVPNKVFEYLAAGLPVVVSDFPEVSALVDGPELSCGWRVRVQAQALLDLVSSIDHAKLAQKKPAVAAAAGVYCWENEESALLRMYAAPTGSREEAPPGRAGPRTPRNI